jgi:hypothetical protein
MLVRGIDRDGEEREILVEHVPLRVLADDLAWAGWKDAAILQDGRVLGGVRFDVTARCRVAWLAA